MPKKAGSGGGVDMSGFAVAAIVLVAMCFGASFGFTAAGLMVRQRIADLESEVATLERAANAKLRLQQAPIAKAS